jgi:tetratricopeptide (TPR) repeat protein
MTWTAPVAEAVQSFLLAGSWEASRAIVHAEPQALLGEEAQELLRALAEEAREAGDERAAALIDEHRRLLERSREEGVEAAFADLVAPIAPTDLDAVLAELAQEPSTPAENERRLELCRLALEVVSRDDNPELWALLQASLGTSLIFATLRDRAENVEGAIAAYEAALEELDGAARARTLNNLGLALEARLTGEPDENREKAIEAYKAALEVIGSEGTGEERAGTLSNLANAFNRRQTGRRDDNREHAISLYEEALRLSSNGEATLDQGQIRVNLGIALMERASGNRLENLDRAIDHFETALRRLDATFFPEEWARAQANLGIALQLRATTTGAAEDYERAVLAHQAALETYGALQAPLERALTLGNLGNTLLDRPGGDRLANVERAIGCLEEAIRELSPARTPLEWARAHNNLGNALRARIGGDRAGDLEAAIAAYEEALQVLSPRNAPVDYAQTIKNLGTAYRERIEGDRQDNLARAIDAYRDALKVREHIYGPEHPRVASVRYSMAKAQRAAGDLAGAKESLGSALSTDEANPFGDRQRLGRGYRSLAYTARELGELEVAEAALLRALAVDEELHGPNDPEVFVDLRELSRVRRDLGKDEDATEALEQAVTIAELSPSGVDAGVRRALEDLAYLMRKAGDHDVAKRILERADSLDEARYGRDRGAVESRTRLGALFNQARGVMGTPETAESAAKIVRKSRGYVPPRIAAAGATAWRLLDRSKRPPRLTFEEELKGYIGFGSGDAAEGRERGRRESTRLELQMRILIDDVNRFLGDAGQAGQVSGVVLCDRLGGERPIVFGAYNVVFERRRGLRRHVTYELGFESGEGVSYRLEGQKEIDEDKDEDLLAKMFNVPVSLEKDGADGEVLAAGIVSVRHLDFVNQLSTFRVEAATEKARDTAVERFGRVALGPLWVPNAYHVLEAVASTESPTPSLPEG